MFDRTAHWRSLGRSRGGALLGGSRRMLLAAASRRAQFPCGHRIELAIQGLDKQLVLAHRGRRERLRSWGSLILGELGLREEIGHQGPRLLHEELGLESS